jgi:hypothetical protein
LFITCSWRASMARPTPCAPSATTTPPLRAWSR